MTLPVTAMTAALLTLLLIFLATRVINDRLRTKTAFGAGDDEHLNMAKGAHANLTEHAPLALIMMAVLELASANHMALMIIAVAFLAGRFVHAFGMFRHLSTGNMKFRQAGVLITWLAMAAMALWIVYICITVNL